MSRIMLCRLLGATLLAAALAGFSQGQHTQPAPAPPLSNSPTLPQPGSEDPMQHANAERQLNLRNEERQKRLVADTDKLLALATSLHEDVSKTNKNVLSLDVIRRADEIERLAHAVKERMRN